MFIINSYSFGVASKTTSLDTSAAMTLGDIAYQPVRLSDTDGIILDGRPNSHQARHFSIDTSTGAVTAGSTLSIAASGADASDYQLGSRLTSTDILYVWRNTSNSDVEACVIRNTAGTLSKGTTLTAVAGTVNGQVTACLLDSTHVLVCYATSSTSQFFATVLTISGTTVTSGAAQTIGSGHTENYGVAVASLTATEAIVAFDNGTGMSFYGLDISGDTVTEGTIQTLASANVSDNISGAGLDATRAAFFFADSSGRGQVVVAEKSTTTITLGTKTAVFTDADSGFRAYEPSISKINSTRALITSPVRKASTQGAMAQVINITGRTVSTGANQLFMSGAGTVGAASNQSVALSETQGIMMRTDVTDTIYSLRFT